MRTGATIRRYVDELNNRNFAILDRVGGPRRSPSAVSYAPRASKRQRSSTREEYAQSIRNRVEEFPDYTVDDPGTCSLRATGS